MTAKQGPQKGTPKCLHANTPEEAVQELRLSIIIRAMKDYVWARDYIKRHKEEHQEDLKKYLSHGTKRPRNVLNRMRTFDTATRYINECEYFFRSWWFDNLAPEYLSGEGEELIKRLRKMTSKELKKMLEKEEDASC